MLGPAPKELTPPIWAPAWGVIGVKKDESGILNIFTYSIKLQL
jgi:hypothetical protein